MMHSRRVLGVLSVILILSAGPSPAQEFLRKSAAEWVRELESSSTPARRGAAFALGKMGLDGFPAVPDLVKALRDRDPGVREGAAFALGEIGTALGNRGGGAWTDAGPGLLRVLSDTNQDPAVRRSVAFAVGGFGPQAASARSALQTAFNDPDAGVRQNAAWAMGRLGKDAGSEGAGALVRLLSDGDPMVRRDAASALGEIGQPVAGSAVRPLANCCRRDADNDVRKAALEALVSLVGPADKDVASDLRAVLDDKDTDVARAAAFALGNIGGESGVFALPVLREALRHEDPSVRGRAALSLVRMGEMAAPAVPELIKTLKDADVEVRRNSAVALTKIGSKAVAAVPALTEALEPTEHEEVRKYAAQALCFIGKEARSAAPALLRALKRDTHWPVRQWSVCALGMHNLDEINAVGALSEVLQEKEQENRLVRYEAAVRLGVHLRERAPDKAIDVLNDYLNDKSLQVYAGPDTKVTGGVEKGGTGKVTETGSGDPRWMPALALGQIGPRANRPEVIRSLEEAAQAKDRKVQETAREALQSIRK